MIQKVVFRPHPRQDQEAGWVDGPGGQDDLFIRAHHLPPSVL